MTNQRFNLNPTGRDHVERRKKFRKQFERYGSTKQFDDHMYFFFKHPPGLFRVVNDFDYALQEPPYRGNYFTTIFEKRGYIIVCSYLHWPEQAVTSIRYLYHGKAYVALVRSWDRIDKYMQPAGGDSRCGDKRCYICNPWSD